MEERWILFALHDMPNVGWDTLDLIMKQEIDLRLLLENGAAALLRGWGVSRRRAEQIEQTLTNAYVMSKLNFYYEQNISIVTWYDETYPPMLRFVYKAPWVLYVKGNVELLSQSMIAVVGTRYPTSYGRQAAEWFGAELAAAGFSVVSGMARGIDSAAHRGALQVNGPTVAVLGSGINVIYPPEHSELQRTIEKAGLVVSEYGWNVKPSAGTFPMRNRIIAGMSRGTLVVEAAEQSGSLITASYALEAGRDIFAVPGLITSPKSAGCYTLIRDGAMLATSPNVILREYGVPPREAEQPTSDGASQASVLTQEEAEVLAVMGAERVTLDDLTERSGRSFGHLHGVLLSLLIKQRIRALPGSAYISRLK